MARATRRDGTKESFWRRMVRGQARSRMSVRAWCLAHQLREPMFYWWRSELRRRDAAAPRTAARPVRRSRSAFVPVRVAEDFPANRSGSIAIVLEGGRRIQVSGRVDRRMLSDVLAVLDPGYATGAGTFHRGDDAMRVGGEASAC